MTTETHQVDHSTCAAAGCPGLATHSRGTNGEAAWYCFIHFSNEPADSLRITNELNRVRWIVDIVRCLRAGQPLTEHMVQNFVLVQRSDLKQSDREDARQWMVRLETVLQQSCHDSVVQP